MNRSKLADVVADIEVLLLDFDGPVCSVFAGHPANQVANRMHEFASDISLPARLAMTTAPMDFARMSLSLGAQHGSRIP